MENNLGKVIGFDYNKTAYLILLGLFETAEISDPKTFDTTMRRSYKWSQVYRLGLYNNLVLYKWIVNWRK